MHGLTVIPRDESRNVVDDRDLRMVWGFVAAADARRAAYYVRWDDARPAEGSLFVLSIGRWEEDALPAERQVVALDALAEEGKLTFMVVDADTTPFVEQADLGRMTTRAEVVGTDLAEAAFLLAEAILASDDRLPADGLRGL